MFALEIINALNEPDEPKLRGANMTLSTREDKAIAKGKSFRAIARDNPTLDASEVLAKYDNK